MKAALTLAEMGIKSILVEKEPQLGGRLRFLYSMFPSDEKAEDIITPIIEKVKKNRLIKVMTSSELEDLEGYIGNYKATIRQGNKKRRVQFGTIIVATGFKEIDIERKSENIISQTELEMKIRENSLKEAKSVVFINCVGALDKERPYCCRIGCGVSIKNAKLIKERFPDSKVYILYKDMRVFGKEEEEYYSNVLLNHRVTMIRYSKEPKITPGKKVSVKVFDDLLHEEISIESDLVVLTVNTEGEAEKLKNMLKVPVDAGGFFVEAHAKIKPLDFSTSGIYLCGSAHYPKNLPDSIAQAEGAASRAAIPILQERMRGEGIISEVNEDLCRGCGICESACAYSAIEMKTSRDRLVAHVNKALCKGCGACAGACLAGAIQQKGYDDKQINTMISALTEV
jgi:heterodisulfide reductase subunit A